MHWIRRALIIALPVALFLVGRAYYYDRQHDKADQLRDRALVVAQLWVATAPYRDSTAMYLSYRDSLLQSQNMSLSEMKTYFEQYQNQPESYAPFVKQVSLFVDSLLSDKKDTSSGYRMKH